MEPLLVQVDCWAAGFWRSRRIIRTAVAGQKLAGLSVAGGAGGDIAWAEAFGWVDIETPAPVTPNTRFRVGNAFIVLTSAAVGALLEKDRLTLDDEIQHGPGVSEEPVAGDAAAVDGEYRRRRDRWRRRKAAFPPTLRAARGSRAHEALLFEPGTQYRYSKYGWILVSAAVEAAAHQPVLRFMELATREPTRRVRRRSMFQYSAPMALYNLSCYVALAGAETGSGLRNRVAGPEDGAADVVSRNRHRGGCDHEDGVR